MKQKKVPMRMCVITHERVEKKNLIRIVKTESGVIVDSTGRVNGHGVYIKKDIDVIKKAQTSKILDKLLETEIPSSVYEEATKLV